MEEEPSTVSTLSSETLRVNYPNNLNHAKNARVSKFKGIWKQKNGHWGAQINSNGHIGLGTFRSETEAAMAYDSASIKLRKLDPHRNFPWNPMTIQEPNFQNQFSTAGVLNMIKDHSYPLKFTEFLRKKSESGNYKHGNGMIPCTELFRKELTPSDVGKLNRLVIPKKFALRHFPSTSEDALFLKMVDRSNKLWQFRYCYWNSSQSFVFTKGWNKFVKGKNLKVNDEVIFYKCEPLNASRDNVTYYMIDVARDNCLDNNGLIQEEVEMDIENGEIENKEDPEAGKIVLQLGQSRVESKGIRLFGVQIVPHTAP